MFRAALLAFDGRPDRVAESLPIRREHRFPSNRFWDCLDESYGIGHTAPACNPPSHTAARNLLESFRSAKKLHQDDSANTSVPLFQSHPWVRHPFARETDSRCRAEPAYQKLVD